MSGIEELIDTYCQVWSHPDPNERQRLLGLVWAGGATYTDPRADTCGAQELLAHIANIQAQRPGAVVERTSRIDEHHGLGRFHWHVRLPDGSTLPQGIDFFELTDERRIARIVGFFGPL